MEHLEKDIRNIRELLSTCVADSAIPKWPVDIDISKQDQVTHLNSQSATRMMEGLWLTS